jgi:hypothetical protein
MQIGQSLIAKSSSRYYHTIYLVIVSGEGLVDKAMSFVGWKLDRKMILSEILFIC